jgi:GDP-L-fucose synthase
MFKNKKVLVTGGHGMIGRELVSLLIGLGANVTVADISENTNLENVNYKKIDLRYFDQCLELCTGQEIIFNLVGIKGSPKMCAEQPADFMVPMLQFNTNMMEAAMRANVEWYLYTSSVGVYHPAEVFKEDDVWSTFPSPNDRFAGWAKRIGELQAEAYAIQYGKKNISIVRPANVYGKNDNFNPENAMVIPSLIRKADEKEFLEVWGDGSAIRDFIHAKDVALGMIHAVENKVTQPINLGSGDGVSIRQIAEVVSKSFNKPIKWLTDKPTGDKRRVFDMTRAHSYGFKPTISIEDGIEDTIDWFLQNKETIDKRFNAFTHDKEE